MLPLINLKCNRSFINLLLQRFVQYMRSVSLYVILEKWFPLRGERAHSLKLFCMYDKRFEISKTK